MVESGFAKVEIRQEFLSYSIPGSAVGPRGEIFLLSRRQ